MSDLDGMVFKTREAAETFALAAEQERIAKQRKEHERRLREERIRNLAGEIVARRRAAAAAIKAKAGVKY
jgi:hypothetical protein